MHRSLLAVAATLTLAVACAPTLRSNQTFLVSEELKLAASGHASLKSTGETLDLAPIQAQEAAKAERVVVLKIHGAYIAVGEGYQRVWRLWPGGRDELKYEPIELPGGKAGFQSVSMEPSGDCALLKWTRDGSPAKAYVNADGDVNENACSEG